MGETLWGDARWPCPPAGRSGRQDRRLPLGSGANGSTGARPPDQVHPVRVLQLGDPPDLRALPYAASGAGGSCARPSSDGPPDPAGIRGRGPPTDPLWRETAPAYDPRDIGLPETRGRDTAPGTPSCRETDAILWRGVVEPGAARGQHLAPARHRPCQPWWTPFTATRPTGRSLTFRRSRSSAGRGSLFRSSRAWPSGEHRPARRPPRRSPLNPSRA